MALSPQYKMNEAGDGMIKVRGHRQAHPAATKYKVLDSSSGCSLVELEPFTGETTFISRDGGGGTFNFQLSLLSLWFVFVAAAAVKHQMRVHMAFALTCPILGDHKYSHLSKLAPQVQLTALLCIWLTVHVVFRPCRASELLHNHIIAWIPSGTMRLCADDKLASCISS